MTEKNVIDGCHMAADVSIHVDNLADVDNDAVGDVANTDDVDNDVWLLMWHTGFF